MTPERNLCPECRGVGRLPDNPTYCICFTGFKEFCTVHNDTAIVMWGVPCDACNGTGIQKK